MDQAVFYPERGKILINAYFYSFWISLEEFKKYNLEYKISQTKFKDKTIETDLIELENRTKQIKI